MTKRYETREAVVVALLTMLSGQTPNIRENLIALSDIPNDRLDLATEEITSALPDLLQIVGMAKVLDPEFVANRESLLAMLPSAPWVDDDKGELTTTVQIRDEEGEEVATASVKRKL